MSDRAREGLFSSLGPAVQGARVLDLFAGTGAVGLEALSRGAVACTFVDSAPGAVQVVRENLRRTRLASGGTVRRQEVLRFLRQAPGQFDLVLADPPYAAPAADVEAVLSELAGQGVVAAGGRVALTRPSRNPTVVIPVHWALERRLSYGDAVVLVFRTS
jgi:16S rRNA (guanine966-N2)-methyltransferase